MLKQRYSAVILTPVGLVTVKDRNDKYVQDDIKAIENNPDKNDQQKAAGVEIVKGGKHALPGGELEPGENPRETIIREIGQELNLMAESRNMVKLAEIVGKTRRHIIYLVKATGMIALDPEETITGIGFLNKFNVFPLIHEFFQTHVLRMHARFFSNDRREERETQQVQFGSNLRVSEILIQQWYEDEQRALIYRGNPTRHRQPKLIEPSPNLTILNRDGRPIPIREATSLTKSAAAKFIPRSPDSGQNVTKPGTRKTSDPAMKAVKPPSNPRMKAVREDSPADGEGHLNISDGSPKSDIKPTIKIEDYSSTKEKMSSRK